MISRKKAELAREKKKVGRPSIYTKALGQLLAKTIATSTDSLKDICESNPHFPARQTIYEWLYDKPEFAVMYDAAKRAQAALYAEAIVDISDLQGEDPARSRLRVDTRKWIACKLIPRVYGDRQVTETVSQSELDLKETVAALERTVALLKKHERDH